MTTPGEGSVTNVSVTIPKPPITSVTASVAAPVKGNALATTVNVGSAAAYTGTVVWYEGSTATGNAVTGNAKANQVYTAKITLTAKEGESFAASITAPTGYTLGEYDTGKVILTKTFPPTADKDPLTGTITITGTPKIGSKLTAATSGLPTDSGALTYKWYRGSELISGATGSTYTPSSAADVGKKIKVEVSAANYSGSLSATTNNTVMKKDYSGTVKTPVVYSTTDTQVTVNKETGYEYAVTLKSATEPNSWSMSGIIGGLTPNTEYKLWGRVAATDTTNASTAVSTLFTTSKAPISSVTISGLDTPAKGGTPDTTVTVTPTGVTAEVKWYKGNTEVTGKFVANTEYTVKITLTATDGNSFANTVTADGYDVTSNSGTVLVLTKTFRTDDKTTPTISFAPTASAITYGQTLNDSNLTNGKAMDGSTEVSGTFKWTDSSIAPQVKDSNTTEYEVIFTPTDTDNYNTATCKVTLTVDPKSITVTVDDISDRSYTGSQITPFVTVKYGDKTLELNTDYTVEYGTNKDVGTGTVTVKAKSGGNYTFTEVAKNFNIKAATSTISITGDPSKTYDGHAVIDPAVSKSGSTGAVTYTYYTNEECTAQTTTANGASSNGAAPKNAGNYWVKATLNGDGNHNSATSAAKAFTISKAAVDGIPGYTAIDASGKILEDVGLNFGTITIDGDLQWVLPLSDDTPVEQGKSYRWRFTPDDKNYAALEGTITPWPASGSGSVIIITPTQPEKDNTGDNGSGKNPTTGAVSDHIGYAAAGLAVVGALCVGAKKLAKKDED